MSRHVFRSFIVTFCKNLIKLLVKRKTVLLFNKFFFKQISKIKTNNKQILLFLKGNIAIIQKFFFIFMKPDSCY